MIKSKSNLGNRLRAVFFCMVSLTFVSALEVEAQTAPSEGTAISTPHARALARRAFQQGDLVLADALSSALLRRDPNDAEALLVRSFLLRRAGRLDEALDAASKSHKHAKIPALRFDAAMLAADILAREEKFTRAQIWLRRADQTAPDEPRREFAAKSHRQLSLRNPLKVQLSFAVRPSDNINGGTNPDEQVDTGFLPLSGQEPLEGIEASLGFALSYRLSENQKQRTSAILQFYGRKVFISDTELAKIFNGRESNYDYASLFAGIQHSRLIFEDLGVSSFLFRVGSSYYERDIFTNAFEFNISQEIKLAENSALSFGIGRKSETRIEADIASSVTHTLSASYLHRLQSGNSYQIGIKANDIDSESGGVNGQQLEASVRYRWADPIWGLRPDVSLRGRFRDYPDFQILGRRMDRSLYATLGVTLDDFKFYGFQPRIEMSFAKTKSNIVIFDSEAAGIGFNFVSRF